MTLRQIAINPTLIDPDWVEQSSKNSYLLKNLKELSSNGHRILVFSQFTRQLTHIKNEAKKLGLNVLYLDGSTSQEERTHLVDKFQSNEVDVFHISKKAGGTGQI